MSASLVGSEMCIRDRPYTGAWLPTRAEARPTPPLKRSWPKSVQHMKKSVSYTHLTLPTICSV
eukprot:11943150-Alexandrium_andersonii.AAC.1